MGKITNTFAVLLCVAAASAKSKELTSTNTCMHYLKDKVSAASKTFGGGEWIDDGLALDAGSWEPGMDVMAVNYCMTRDDKFGALQLFVGHKGTVIELEKHGEAGSNPDCFRWDLVDGDYIRFI